MSDAWVGWGDEPDDDPADGRDHDAEQRRTKRIALIGLASVLVIVAITVLLVRLVDTSSGAPSGPADAARQWGLAVVHGARGRERRLECASGAELGRTLRLVVRRSGRVTTDPAIKDGPAHWHVALHLPGLEGRSYLVAVQRRDDAYLVCRP